jgi:hypothetical protein
MDQLLRREFLLKVLFTIGTSALIELSELSLDAITQKSLGQSDITDLEIELIYHALTVVA